MSIEQIIQANTQAINNLTHAIRALLDAHGAQQSSVAQTPVVNQVASSVNEIATSRNQIATSRNQIASSVEELATFDETTHQSAPTLAELRDAFIKMGEKCGKDSQLNLLKEFGAKKLGEVDPTQFGAVLKVINMMVEAANG